MKPIHIITEDCKECKLNKDYYSKLRSYIDHNYVPLDYLLPNKGRKNEKWKILDNIK